MPDHRLGNFISIDTFYFRTYLQSRGSDAHVDSMNSISLSLFLFMSYCIG